MKKLKLFMLVLLSLFLFNIYASDKSGVLYEEWRGIKGDKVKDLTSNPKYKKTADFALILRTLQRYNSGEDFGARFSALLIPPATGDYTFFLSSDDEGELWLSSDDKAENLRKIASVPNYTEPNVWDTFPLQKSITVKLEVGKKYFIRVLQKQGGGKDHVEVAWRGPGIRFEIIPLRVLYLPDMDTQTEALTEKCMTLLEDSQKTLDKLKDLPKGKLLEFVAKIPEPQIEIITKKIEKLITDLTNDSNSENMKKAEVFYRKALEITPSKKHPVSNPLLMKLLNLESVYLANLPIEQLRGVGPHRTASVMGEIPADAKTEEGRVKLSSKASKGRDYELICTGFYALPGELATITVPPELAGKKLQLQLGHHLDASGKVKSLYSMPKTTVTKDITSVTTDFITPYGGLIFIKVPKGVSFKDQIFRISGALKAPRFVLGETSDKKWKTIRDYPGPWGELVADRIVFVVPSPILKKVDNPTALMEWWNKNLIRQEEFYGYNINMPFRMHVSFYPVRGCSTWPLYETEETILQNLNLKSLEVFNLALFLHEHGHHADDSRMMFQNMGESTPNWGGYYLKGVYGDFDWKDTVETHLMRLFDRTDEMHNDLKQDKWWQTKWTHYWSYPITSMMLGYVQDFGWTPFKNCVHRFNDPGDPVNNLKFCKTDGVEYGLSGRIDAKNQAVMDKWLIFMSEEAKRDVTPYMAHFYIKPSHGCRTFIDSKKYKKWDLVYIPERPVLTPVNTSVQLASPAKYALTMSKNLKFSLSGKPAHGTVTDKLVYTPEKGFIGEDKIPFTLTDRYGNIQKKNIIVKVLKSDDMPHFTAAVLSSVKVGVWSKIKLSEKYRKPVVLASILPGKNSTKRVCDSYVVRIRNLTPKGFEITIQSISDKPIEAEAFPVSLSLLESGKFTLAKSGFRADIGTVELKPETLSDALDYQYFFSENDRAVLRDSNFGQILSSKNQQWSQFFSGTPFEKRSKAIGAYGTSTDFKEKESVGYAFLKYGFYQFGNKNIKITPDAVSVDNTVVKMTIPDLGSLKQNFKRSHKK